jgi:hypothetical protein
MNMKRTYKSLLLLFSIFFANAFSAYGQDLNLEEGIWVLEKCEIQKDSAGTKLKVDYQLTDGNIPQWYIFTELTFGKEKSCSIKLGEDVIAGKYMQKGDILSLDFVLMIPDYSYSFINNNTLVLKRRHRFQEIDAEYFVDIEMSYSLKTEQDED